MRRVMVDIGLGLIRGYGRRGLLRILGGRLSLRKLTSGGCFRFILRGLLFWRLWRLMLLVRVFRWLEVRLIMRLSRVLLGRLDGDSVLWALMVESMLRLMVCWRARMPCRRRMVVVRALRRRGWHDGRHRVSSLCIMLVNFRVILVVARLLLVLITICMRGLALDPCSSMCLSFDKWLRVLVIVLVILGLVLMVPPLILLMPTSIRGKWCTIVVNLRRECLAVVTWDTIRRVARTLLLAAVRLATIIRLSRLLLRMQFDLSTVLRMH